MSAVETAAQRGPGALTQLGQWMGFADPTTAVSVALCAVVLAIGVGIGIAVALAERKSGQ